MVSQANWGQFVPGGMLNLLLVGRVRFPLQTAMLNELEVEVSELTEKSEEYLFALKDIIYYLDNPALDDTDRLWYIREKVEPFRKEDV